MEAEAASTGGVVAGRVVFDAGAGGKLPAPAPLGACLCPTGGPLSARPRRRRGGPARLQDLPRRSFPVRTVEGDAAQGEIHRSALALGPRRLEIALGLRDLSLSR